MCKAVARYRVCDYLEIGNDSEIILGGCENPQIAISASMGNP